MRDGVKLAVDTYVPEGGGPTGKFPAILILTPYYRRFKLSGPGADPSPNAAIYRDFFVPRGYALVVVDVRGTGASFGTRDSFRSPRERLDHAQIADWVVKQPWSSGVIGATGISYLGAASCFLASTGHPAVKAIAPLFATHDTYADHVFPGGIKCATVTENYDHLVHALDLDQRDQLGPYPYFNAPNYAGPQPVDADTDGSLLAAALDAHRDSFHLRDLAPEMAYREEPSPHDPELHSGACSPYYYLQQARGKVAIYSISGWYDGCAFANSSVSRFLSMAGPHDRLLLGPWDHGARTNGSPFRDSGPVPQFPILAEVLRFFDTHLLGMKTGIEDEAPIHYHTLHEEKWKAATQWPPHPGRETLYLATFGDLTSRAGTVNTSVEFNARLSLGTGRHTRYERLGALAVTDYYQDWNGRENDMLVFETIMPFKQDVEVTGHVIVHLNMETSERDGAVFAYLSELDSEGRSWYVTEGGLRMLHRATAPCPPEYVTTWPWRTYSRADANLMEPNVPDVLSFALLPVSWRFSKGSKMRLSLAGADADHFAQVPHGRPSRWIVKTGSNGARIEVPFVGASGI